MSKVKITKAQAEFIEGFKKPWYQGNDKKVEITKGLPIWAGQALHNLMQFGFGEGLEDAYGKDVTYGDIDGDFEHKQVPLLIEAVMHGYEIKEEKVVLFVGFSDGSGENRKLYYGSGIHVTRKSTATEYDLNVEWEAKKVEELKTQGWEVEEAE